jgi:hypothetical protein
MEVKNAWTIFIGDMARKVTIFFDILPRSATRINVSEEICTSIFSFENQPNTNPAIVGGDIKHTEVMLPVH